MHRRLKWAFVVAVVAIVAKLVAFGSPGWAVVSVHFPVDRNEELEELEREESGDIPAAIALELEMGEVREGRRLTVSMGLWYFVACVGDVQHRRGWFAFEREEKGSKCFLHTYKGAKEAAEKVKREDYVLKGTLEKIGCKYIDIND